MDKVNVLVLTRLRLSGAYLDDIAAVDPRISLKDGTGQFVAELRSSGKKGPLVDYFESESARMGDSPSVGSGADLDSLLAEAEVVFGALMFPEKMLSRSPRLKWVHVGGTGIDRYLSSGIFDGDIIVTNSRGAVAVPIAEHAMGFMFALAKDTPRLLDSKHHKRWEAFPTMELRNKTVGIIGLGAIGSEVARLAKGIGMKDIATKRSAAGWESGVSGVDELYPVSDLHPLLSGSDFVVVSAPLTEETKGMIGEAELQAMKPSAYFINVARGQIVDQPALIRALKEGWIAAAGLDVFETDPLHPDSELWELPNAVLSYHMAGMADTYTQRVIGLFCENLRRYLAGEQLLNVIHKDQKY